MTNKTAAMFLEERKNGLTHKEIAGKYGLSENAVFRICDGAFRWYTEEEVIYPGLRRWLNENQVTRKDFAWRMGRSGKSMETEVSKWFRGTRCPSKQTIDKMLKVTGLTYEELFREEAK